MQEAGAPGVLAVYDIKEDEALAGDTEGFRCLLFAHADDDLAGLAKPCRQFVEIAVAGDDAEALHIACVEDIHGIDDQPDVGGILPRCVVGLHDRCQGVAGGTLHPGVKPVLGPVTVHAADRDLPVFGEFTEDPGYIAGTDVIGINEQCDIEIFHCRTFLT